MFPIYRATELAHHLGASVAELRKVLQSPGPYYEELLLSDPSKPDKKRTVLSVKAPLRKWQGRFYRDVLLEHLERSEFSHGSRPGHSIKTNAEKHVASRYVYKADVSDFYPSIHNDKVYRLFAEQFGCSPDVADLCSRLCTYKHHLALGLSTSPIIADQLMRNVDARIGAACRKLGWVYTRYVDDIIISGPNNLEDSGIKKTVARILREHGFKAKKSKDRAGSQGEITITGVRVVEGHLDVAKEYAQELERQLADALSLTHDREFDGPYYTHGQLAGRVRFVCWINPRRARTLKIKLAKLSRQKMAQHAAERELVVSKKRLSKLAPTGPA
jgi:RNA-directed DNA polymerase